MAPCSFEDLLTADTAVVQKTIAEFSIRDTVLALKGASPQMNEFIVGLMPKEDAAALSDEKMRIGTVPLIQVEQAQEHILQTYLRFLQAGKESL